MPYIEGKSRYVFSIQRDAYLNSKKYDVTIYEKSNKLLSGFNSIQIGKYKLNNGFHGFEYPRTKQLINFLQNK